MTNKFMGDMTEIYNYNDPKHLGDQNVYRHIRQKGEASFSKEELTALCKLVIQSPVNRAMTIFNMVEKNLWDDTVAEPCQAILDSPGEKSLAIAAMKTIGAWKDDVAEPCQAILNTGKNIALAIFHAKLKGWWDDAIAEPCKLIKDSVDDHSQGILIRSRKQPWWVEPV